MRKPTTKIGRVRKWIRKKFSKKVSAKTYYQPVVKKRKSKRRR